jgi:hypothetical protein
MKVCVHGCWRLCVCVRARFLFQTVKRYFIFYFNALRIADLGSKELIFPLFF